jgi:hypothetical protein
MYYAPTGTGIITYDEYDNNTSITYPSKEIIYNNYCNIYKSQSIKQYTTASYITRQCCTKCTTASSWASDDDCYGSRRFLKKDYVAYKYEFSKHAFEYSVPPIPLSDRFRQIIQSRQAPLFIPSRTPIKAVAEEREIRARQTLRRILGDDGFRRFLRNGFVSVRANSGKIYQIYPGHGMTVVYDRGTPIEKLCVVLHGDFTPTDSLITRYVMILHDEADFRALANVWTAPAKRVLTFRQLDTRPLTQIFQSLKAAA